MYNFFLNITFTSAFAFFTIFIINLFYNKVPIFDRFDYVIIVSFPIFMSIISPTEFYHEKVLVYVPNEEKPIKMSKGLYDKKIGCKFSLEEDKYHIYLKFKENYNKDSISFYCRNVDKNLISMLKDGKYIGDYTN